MDLPFRTVSPGVLQGLKAALELSNRYLSVHAEIYVKAFLRKYLQKYISDI